MGRIKKLCPVAHDNRKENLIEWLGHSHRRLAGHRLIKYDGRGRSLEPLFDNVPLPEIHGTRRCS
jgi:methylglyoxal synthase